MARLFDDAATEYLEVAKKVVATQPLTITGWVRSDDVAANQTVLCIALNTAGNKFQALCLRGQTAGDPVSMMSLTSGGPSVANSTAGFVANAWCHAAGVVYGAASRAAFINGGNKGTEGTDEDPGDVLNCTSIGRLCDSSPDYYMSGGLAEVCLYDVALTDLEIKMLYWGVPPWRIRRNRLKGFWLPIGIRDDRDYSGRGGNHMTAYNTPSWAADPPMLLRWRT